MVKCVEFVFLVVRIFVGNGPIVFVVVVKELLDNLLYGISFCLVLKFDCEVILWVFIGLKRRIVRRMALILCVLTAA